MFISGQLNDLSNFLIPNYGFGRQLVHSGCQTARREFDTEQAVAFSNDLAEQTRDSRFSVGFQHFWRLILLLMAHHWRYLPRVNVTIGHSYRVNGLAKQRESLFST